MGKFEKKFGKYAVQNIIMYLIICYLIGFIIEKTHAEWLNLLTLNPDMILRGQVWRLVSWLLIPPDTTNLFFTLIMLYFYYSIGRILEQVWGAYRLNVYIFSGILFTVIGSFLMYGIFVYLTGGDALLLSTLSAGYATFFTTSYINMSLFLAYAATFPDMQVLLFFIIPLRVKVLGIVYGVLIGIELFSCYSTNLFYGIITTIIIGSSLLNFLIFFITSRKIIRRTPIQRKQKIVYEKEVKTARRQTITKHRCAICDRTDESNPELEFRFCSKCIGNYEYCSDHLFSHTHVKY